MLSFYDFIIESRKNPELNPKVSAYEFLSKFKNDPDVYIQFSNVNKLGINPISEFDTPQGIYSYPLKNIWDEYNLDGAKSLSNLPYATNRKYIILFKYIKERKLLDVAQYNENDLVEDIEKLYDSKTHSTYHQDLELIKDLHHKFETYSSSDSYEECMRAIEYYNDKRSVDENGYYINSDDKIIKKFVNEYNKIISSMWVFRSAIKSSKQNTPMFKFWNICRWLANNKINPELSNKKSFKLDSFKSKSETSGVEPLRVPTKRIGSEITTNWNTILRKLGYDGFTDKNGLAVIHENEPIQAFFVKSAVVKVIDVILNKDYKAKDFVVLTDSKTFSDNWEVISTLGFMSLVVPITMTTKEGIKDNYILNQNNLMMGKSVTLENLIKFFDDMDIDLEKYCMNQIKQPNIRNSILFLSLYILYSKLPRNELSFFIRKFKEIVEPNSIFESTLKGYCNFSDEDFKRLDDKIKGL